MGHSWNFYRQWTYLIVLYTSFRSVCREDLIVLVIRSARYHQLFFVGTDNHGHYLYTLNFLPWKRKAILLLKVTMLHMFIRRSNYVSHLITGRGVCSLAVSMLDCHH